MSKNNATATQAIVRNEKIQCDVSSCGSSRYGLSRYCLKHKEKDIRYGSPTGSSFMLNGGFNIAGGNLLSHIIDAESVCLPILEDLSAAYIHAMEVKNLNDRELTYALSNSLYRHVPRNYKTVVSSQGKSSKRPTVKMGSRARSAIGEYVRKELPNVNMI